MAIVSCPKCSTQTKTGGYQTWQIVVSVCFFPIGLLSLLAGKKPTTCGKCGHTW